MDTIIKKGLRVYLAGELFDFKHLAGNALVGDALERCSGGRYVSLLPQDLELPSLDAKAIRDADYGALLGCDAAVFHFDGADLDSGTVAEFMAAKFVDMPAVATRTDFRRGGDRNPRPWNLMCDSFPRTETLVLDAMAMYSEIASSGRVPPVLAIEKMAERIARLLLEKLDKVVGSETVLSDEERSTARALLRKSCDLSSI